MFTLTRAAFVTASIMTASLANGQTTTEKPNNTVLIAGAVMDQGDTVVPDVTVTVMAAGQSNAVVSTKTDQNGFYTISIRPGSYELRFTAAGFAVATTTVTAKPGEDVGVAPVKLHVAGTAITPSDQPRMCLPCSTGFGLKRHIVSSMGFVEFRVSRSVQIRESHDVDYVLYNIPYRTSTETVWLTMMLGPQVGGNLPDDLKNSSIKWTHTQWRCKEIGDDEWRGVAGDGLRWRHVSVPLSGYAAYEGVPPNAAEYFDKILDTMCCRNSQSRK